MLVLSRAIGEQIVIGDNIVITVTDISTNRVRIGIVAPNEVRVDRSEVRERIDEEGKWEKWADKPPAQ